MKPRVLYTGPENSSISHQKFEGYAIEHKPFLKITQDFDQNLLKSILNEFQPDILACSSKNAMEAQSFALAMNNQIKALAGININHLKRDESRNISLLLAEEKNTDSLISLLKKEGIDSRILFLSADISINKNRELLNSTGLASRCFIAYKSEEIYQDINIDSFEAIVFTSYSGIDNLLKQYSIPDDTVCFCIAPKTSEYLKQKYNGPVITADNADIDTLFQNIESYFNERAIT